MVSTLRGPILTEPCAIMLGIYVVVFFQSETFGSKLKRLSGVHKRVHAASVPPYQFVQVLGPSLKGAAELALCKVTGSRKLAPGLTPDQRPMEQPTAKHNPKLRGVLKLDPPDPQDEEPGHWKAAKAGETCTNTEDDVLGKLCVLDRQTNKHTNKQTN